MLILPKWHPRQQFDGEADGPTIRVSHTNGIVAYIDSVETGAIVSEAHNRIAQEGNDEIERLCKSLELVRFEKSNAATSYQKTIAQLRDQLAEVTGERDGARVRYKVAEQSAANAEAQREILAAQSVDPWTLYTSADRSVTSIRCGTEILIENIPYDMAEVVCAQHNHSRRPAPDTADLLVRAESAERRVKELEARSVEPWTVEQTGSYANSYAVNCGGPRAIMHVELTVAKRVVDLHNASLRALTPLQEAMIEVGECIMRPEKTLTQLQDAKDAVRALMNPPEPPKPRYEAARGSGTGKYGVRQDDSNCWELPPTHTEAKATAIAAVLNGSKAAPQIDGSAHDYPECEPQPTPPPPAPAVMPWTTFNQLAVGEIFQTRKGNSYCKASATRATCIGVEPYTAPMDDHARVRPVTLPPVPQK